MLADGYSVRQIGDALNISPKTVETHKYSVLTKLRAGSINELTKMAIRLGLVSL
ncbi:response regulator transcription factor [Desulfovibrio piger]|uniref:response regulator transcription factor n=1 Tax=Desulfovibrio piger TaxID=901 RepID=UPI0034C6AC4B